MERGRSHTLPLPAGTYRVRYSARGMDYGRDANQLDDGPPVDTYRLQFWPGQAAPDRLRRQTSSAAAYWNRANRDRPLPPAEQEADDRQAHDEQEQYFRTRYDGYAPNVQLREADAHAGGLLLIDRDLLIALSEAGSTVQRDVARWAALQALTVARLIDWPPIASATAALQAGETPPAPFDETHGWYAVADALPPSTSVPRLPVLNSADPEGVNQQMCALASMGSTSAANPLVAVIDALESAAHVHGPDGYIPFLAGLRAAFPVLSRGIAGNPTPEP